MSCNLQYTGNGLLHRDIIGSYIHHKEDADGRLLGKVVQLADDPKSV